MAGEKKRMGRGLAALFGQISSETVREPETVGEPAAMLPGITDNTVAGSQSVDIMLLDRNPYQPRQEFDETELDRLTESLQNHGLLQPLVVRKAAERYQIIAGERRYRAAMRAGWREVPVHCVRAEERDMVELALTENLQRKDLNAIEKAYSFARYLETYGGTHEELAKRLEVERCTVSNLMRLLDLPLRLQDAVKKGTLTAGHARALLPLGQFGEQGQLDAAKKIQEEGWSVRTTEEYVDGLLNGSEPQENWNVVGPDGQTRPAAPPSSREQSEQVRQLEQSFREYLGGIKVKLTQTNTQGKGKLTISFANHAEFERIQTLFSVKYKAA
ncbi:MAG: ParB/RepB/Spo0J family partition protein [Planctomycetaceae bacterium]|jgi:ParB family chromosome partitioning protein|nr:ParB/RepB/Spo0J family partition protein [Planctomycetaceae bacterium]